MELAKEFIKNAPGYALLVGLVGAIALGSTYLFTGMVGNLHVQINNYGKIVGTLQAKVTDLEHKIDFLELKNSSCQLELEKCQEGRDG